MKDFKLETLESDSTFNAKYAVNGGKMMIVVDLEGAMHTTKNGAPVRAQMYGSIPGSSHRVTFGCYPVEKKSKLRDENAELKAKIAALEAKLKTA